MRKPIAIGLIGVGVVLIVLGVNASDSFSSEVSEFFEGSPTNQAMWLLIGGVFAALVGGAMLMGGSRRVTA